MIDNKYQIAVGKVLCGVALALGALTCAAARADTISIDDALDGWVASDGKGDMAAPLNNTITGRLNGVQYNSWAAFYIPPGSYTSATLSLAPAVYGSAGPSDFGLFDVTTPMKAFDNTHTPGVDIFEDIGGGRQYAAVTLYDTPVTFSLNGRALADINSEAGAYFLVGFTNFTANAKPASADEAIYLSGLGRFGVPVVLNLTSASAVPEPAQWISIGAGLLLLGAALARRRAPRRKGALAALAAAALALPLGASADPLDFDSVDPTVIFDGGGIAYGGYQFTSTFVGAPEDGGGLVGALIDGGDPYLCANMACPANNASHYLAALNDGMLSMRAEDGGAFRIGGFDASFISSAPNGDAYISALLQLTGTRADGSTVDDLYVLQSAATGFQSYLAAPDFSDTDFVSVDMYAYYCTGEGKCDAFSSNKGQFALDNVMVSAAVSAVPEPSSWLMLGAGLALMGGAARRRRA